MPRAHYNNNESTTVLMFTQRTGEPINSTDEVLPCKCYRDLLSSSISKPLQFSQIQMTPPVVRAMDEVFQTSQPCELAKRLSVIPPISKFTFFPNSTQKTTLAR